MRARTLFQCWVLLLLPFCGEARPQADDKLEAALERASKAPDCAAVRAVLALALTDDAHIRAAYLTARPLDERTAFVLFSGVWRSDDRALPQKEYSRRRRLLVEAVSTKPVLIRSVIRADRYATWIVVRDPLPASIRNPFTCGIEYADDLVEWWIEKLRHYIPKPADILVPDEEMEEALLWHWQMLCGVCDRLDLIDKSTAKNWRGRYPDLEKWFQANRPFVKWDEARSCFRIDEDSKHDGLPTERTSRRIPELKPPWELGDVSKAPRKEGVRGHH
jgi:hypothetical protein